MKKLTFSLIGAAALMLTACSNEDILENAANDGMVTFTIGIQQNATRALNEDLSQGKMIDRLRYVVLDENDQFLFDGNKSTTFNRTNSANQRFETVEIPLVVGKTYHIVFFADNNGSGYTISNDGVLDMNYNNVYNTNDESRDAFYKYESVKISKGVTPAPVILNRPFAQINVASTAEDVSAAQAAGVVVEKSKYEITGNVYSKLNMLTGVASDPIGVSSVIDFAKADRPNGQISIEGTPYEWLSMVYVLPEAEGDILPMVKFAFDENPDAREYTSIPVKRNFRTNIVGNILTQTNEFTVILDTDFEKPDGNVPTTGAVSTAAELFDALTDGDAATIVGNIALTSTGSPIVIDKDFNLTGIYDAVIEGYGFSGEHNITLAVKGGDVVVEGVTFKVPALTTGPDWAMSCNIWGGSITFRNCTFEGVQCPLYISDGTDSVTLDGCRFNTTGCAIQAEVYSGKTPAITITNCDFTGCADVFHYYQDGIDHAYLLNILDGHGNTYTGTVRATKYE